MPGVKSATLAGAEGTAVVNWEPGTSPAERETAGTTALRRVAELLSTGSAGNSVGVGAMIGTGLTGVATGVGACERLVGAGEAVKLFCW